MPMTKVDNEHEQLVSMLNQLIDEREILTRENEYLKARLNESVLIETINDMKKERDLLFKLLSNLTINSNNEQIRIIKHHMKESPNEFLINPRQNPTISRHTHARVHRVKTNPEQHNRVENPERLSSPSTTNMKRSQSKRNIFICRQQIPEFHKIIRKPDNQLKHSQNSPFQYYRSQSLQNLT